MRQTMNSRKRFHVEVDRLSRIEEDLERMSLYDDQSIQSSQLFQQHPPLKQLQSIQHKGFESMPMEQQFLPDKNHDHLVRDDKLQHQQQMLKQLHAQHPSCQEPLHGKQQPQEVQQCMQQLNHERQYCKLDHSNGDANLFGSHYQHLMDFRSGRLQRYEEAPCSHQIPHDHKSITEFQENLPVPSEGLKFLKEKYDSLGKVRVMKPQGTVVESAPGMQVHQELERSQKRFPENNENKICQQHFVHFNEKDSLHYILDPQQPVDPCITREGMQRYDDQWRHQFDNFHIKDEQKIFPHDPKVQEPQERHLLSDHDLMQVDIFYRSQRSDIFVSRCCANLMLGPKWSFQSTGSLGGSPASGVRQLCRNFRDWACVKSGVPVLVLDTTKNELNLILAEHGLGFAIWRNRMGPLTGYSVIAADFHALRTDPSMQRSLANPPATLVTSIIGLNFVDVAAAEEFYKNVVNLSTLASSPGAALAATRNRHISGDHLKDLQQFEQSLSNSTQDLQASGLQTNKQDGERIKSAKKGKKLSSKSFSKTDISQPCCFTHVTKLGDRFRDGSTKLFLTTSDTNVVLRGNSTIDKKSSLHRLHGGLKQKH